MERFVQLHLLTSYPPANLNRDDLGRPKTAILGGKQRLRISSQCLKRNWRVSDLFKNALNSTDKLELSEGFRQALQEADIVTHLHLGVRTKDMGLAVFEYLKKAGAKEKDARSNAEKIAGTFAKNDSKNKLQTGQLVLYSSGELQAIDTLVKKLVDGSATGEDWKLLRKEHHDVDLAMFGRMLADNPQHNVEAAVQVAHAVTVHEVEVENDFFTAIDDLNLDPETSEAGTDKGAAHLGDNEFGAGLFYLYVCIDRYDLKRNLQDDDALTQQALRALTEAAVKVTPSGKRNSHGHHTYAHYVLAERGDAQPRSLAVAFLKPIGGNGDWLGQARKSLTTTCRNMDSVYGTCAADRYEIDIANGHGKLVELLNFVAGVGAGNEMQEDREEAEA